MRSLGADAAFAEYVKRYRESKRSIRLKWSGVSMAEFYERQNDYVHEINWSDPVDMLIRNTIVSRFCRDRQGTAMNCFPVVSLCNLALARFRFRCLVSICRGNKLKCSELMKRELDAMQHYEPMVKLCLIDVLICRCPAAMDFYCTEIFGALYALSRSDEFRDITVHLVYEFFSAGVPSFVFPYKLITNDNCNVNILDKEINGLAEAVCAVDDDVYPASVEVRAVFLASRIDKYMFGVYKQQAFDIIQKLRSAPLYLIVLEVLHKMEESTEKNELIATVAAFVLDKAGTENGVSNECWDMVMKIKAVAFNVYTKILYTLNEKKLPGVTSRDIYLSVLCETKDVAFVTEMGQVLKSDWEHGVSWFDNQHDMPFSPEQLRPLALMCVEMLGTLICSSSRITERIARAIAIMSPLMYHEHVEELLRIAACSSSIATRLAILRLFIPPYPRALTDWGTPSSVLLELLMKDISPIVSEAAIELVCKTHTHLVLEKELCEWIDHLGGDFGRSVVLAEHCQTMVAIFKYCDEAAMKYGCKFIQNALKHMKGRGEFVATAYFESKDCQAATVALIRAIGALCTSRDNDNIFSVIEGFINDIWRSFRELLSKGISSGEIYEILVVIDIIVRRQGVKIALKNEPIQSILNDVGAKVLASKIHAIIFKIIGFLGPEPAKEVVSPVYVQDVYEDQYNCYRIGCFDEFKLGYAFRFCVRLLCTILESKHESYLHDEAMETFSKLLVVCRQHNSIRCDKEIGIFMPYLWNGLQYSKKPEKRYVRMLKDLCVIYGEFSDLVEWAIYIRSLSVIRAVARAGRGHIHPYVRELVSVVCSFGTRKNEAKTLLVLFKECCRTDRSLREFVFDKLLQSAEFNPSAYVYIHNACVLFPLREKAMTTLGFCWERLDDPEIQKTVSAVFHWFANDSARMIMENKMKQNGIVVPNWDELFASTEADIMNQMEDSHRVDMLDPSMDMRDKLEAFLDETIEEGNKRAVRIWFDELQKLCIHESPNMFVQKCYAISVMSPSFSLHLFNIAFHSIYTGFDDSDSLRGKLLAKIGAIMDMSTKIPTIVLSAFTSLIEFMDRAGSPIFSIKRNDPTLSFLSVGINTLNSLPLMLRFTFLSVSPELTDEDKRTVTSMFARVGLYGQLDDTGTNFDDISNWQRYLPDSEKNEMPIVLKALKALEDKGKDGVQSIIPSLFDELGCVGGASFRQGALSVVPFSMCAQILTEWSRCDPKELKERNSGTIFTAAHASILALLHAAELVDKESDMCNAAKEILLCHLAKSGKWEMFDSFYTNWDGEWKKSIRMRYRQIRSLLESQEETRVDNAQHELDNLIGETTDLNRLRKFSLMKALTTMSIGKIEEDKVVTAIGHLVKDHIDHIGCTYVWGWANSMLYKRNPGNCAKTCLLEAVRSFARCVRVADDRCRETDILRLLDLVLKDNAFGIEDPEIREAMGYGEDGTYFIEEKHLVPLIDHIMPYCRSESESNRKWTQQLLRNLLMHYYEGLVWSFIFMMKCNSEDEYEDEQGIKNIVHACRHESASIDGLFMEAEAIFEGIKSICWPDARYIADVVNDLYNMKSEIYRMTNNPDRKYQFTPTQIARQCMWRFVDPIREKVMSIDPRGDIVVMNVQKYLSEIYSGESTGDIDALAQANQKEVSGLHTLLCAAKKRFMNGDHDLLISKAAPEMSKMKDCAMPVFGTYRISAAQQVTIQNWSDFDAITVRASKMRPRQICLRGSDGNVYQFMCKAKEDLRLDQRSMQFFNIVNRLTGAGIGTYSVIPMSPTIGVLQYLNNTKPMWDFIREYRIHVVGYRYEDVDGERISWRKRCEQERPEMPLEEKCVIFNEIIESTKTRENDLREMFWRSAPSSESWLKYLVNFSQSTAVMSIMGYIIGLGDRHGDNIIVHKDSGKVTHIDFGDALNGAEKRPSFPEKVPFRLTRMMIAAYGPGGHGGMFRRCCEETMTVVQNHQQSLMTMLEIFAREPLSGTSADGAHLSSSYRIRTTAKAVDNVAELHARIANVEKTPVKVRVKVLIEKATACENLASLFSGWIPFW